ncbi:MAG TPA: SGNH/GDSL hydrolase family protein [Ktedonobacteraceae bacterium]|nr:SGNH/GDSL hydrolase family protein [Ktedonobacteraceae bacterium]HEU5383514.1 SGNH/GDSL hydrolase family protein [Ktedonobacteraceae bacterium]
MHTNKTQNLPGWLSVAAITLSLFVSACGQQARATSSPGGAASSGAAASLISRNVPAFASSDPYPAAQANDGSYDTDWRSQGVPAWLAYDLSKVPVARRGKVLVIWYNQSYDYDHTVNGDLAYNLPENYTLDVNAAPGGGNPPDGGWKTLVTVKDNHYHSRQHLIDMSGYNWLRIYVTASDGASENYDASINMDVFDARSALTDDWIFFGDSITAGAMAQYTIGGVTAFAQLINAKVPTHFPVQEGGGIGYLTSADGLQHLKGWLQMFPGKYVGLSYGTNDANGCVDPQKYYNNYVGMVQIILAAGKIPMIPHLPWGRTSNIQQCGPALNAQIDRLYKTFPQIIRGPDLWAFFQQHQTLISNDNIHPTDEGMGQYRLQWANTMLKEVYKVGS